MYCKIFLHVYYSASQVLSLIKYLIEQLVWIWIWKMYCIWTCSTFNGQWHRTLNLYKWDWYLNYIWCFLNLAIGQDFYMLPTNGQLVFCAALHRFVVPSIFDDANAKIKVYGTNGDIYWEHWLVTKMVSWQHAFVDICNCKWIYLYWCTFCLMPCGGELLNCLWDKFQSYIPASRLTFCES